MRGVPAEGEAQAAQQPERGGDFPRQTTSSLDLGTDWGVVDTNYLRMRERPNQTSNLLRGLTRGLVVEIISRTPETELVENETSYWYNINLDGFRGWVFGYYLKIFDSRSAADTYAGGLQ